MDPINGYWVELAELSDRVRLPWGYAGNSTMWRCTFAGKWFVFKEYSEEFRAVADQQALGGLIRWRDTLSHEDRRYLDRVAAWPRHRVRKNGTLLGVLVPFAPDMFFRQMAPDGEHRPNDIAHLIRRTAEGNVIAAAPSYVKTSAIGNAVDVLLWFHRQGVLVNDVRELNILCSHSGSAVYYVDCDVMISFSSWGGVGPAAAPEYLQQLLPPGAPPTRQSDLAKLAWVAAWILLDDFALRDIPQAKLTAVIDAKDAELIIRSSRLEAVDRENWRRLAARWIKWTASATVGPPPGEPQFVTPEPWLPRTKTLPPEQRTRSGWVPERFKEPSLPPAPQPDLTPVMQPRGHGRTLLIVATIAVVVLVGLAACSVLLQGGLR